MLNQAEHREAVAFMKWVQWQINAWPAVAEQLKAIHHIPNGGQRSKAAAGKLKAEGVKKGVSDYFMPAARGGFFGLYIELKAKGGALSPDQRDWLAYVNAEGFLGVVAVGWEQAADAVKAYLSKPRTEIVL